MPRQQPRHHDFHRALGIESARERLLHAPLAAFGVFHRQAEIDAGVLALDELVDAVGSGACSCAPRSDKQIALAQDLTARPTGSRAAGAGAVCACGRPDAGARTADDDSQHRNTRNDGTHDLRSPHLRHEWHDRRLATQPAKLQRIAQPERHQPAFVAVGDIQHGERVAARVQAQARAKGLFVQVQVARL